MYNPKDIQFVGKHDYDKSSAESYAANKSFKTFSVNIFQWELQNNGKRMKKGKGKVRVSGSTDIPELVFKTVENIISELDLGTYTGGKTVKVKLRK